MQKQPVMNDSEVKAVIRQCLKGKNESFSRIVKVYQNPIYRFAYQFTRNTDEAGDAVMEIFIKAFRSLDKFKPAYRFSSWLYTIAYNHLVEKARRNRMEEKYRDSEIAFRTDAFQTETPESLFIREEVREEVKRGLSSLPSRNRIALLLRFHHQLPYKQIGLIMGIPRNTVASLIMRGKKELRSWLEKEET
jgi:RNA polymerase sigma-70 factor (ECF subfamily)